MNRSIFISEEELRDLYEIKKLSAMQIAKSIGCSATGINHLLSKYRIEKRSLSEAIYVLSNPDGDPFSFRQPETAEEWQLYGMGLGLYWGEGNKANHAAVKISNTDPRMLKAFMDFMERFFLIGRNKIRIQIQVFTDIDIALAIAFWARELDVEHHQFNKPIITPSDSMGTHRNKSKYGVVAIIYTNTKLRKLFGEKLAEYARGYGEPQELTVPRDKWRSFGLQESS